MTLGESHAENDILTITQRYQSMVFYGNALFHLGEFTKAEASI